MKDKDEAGKGAEDLSIINQDQNLDQVDEKQQQVSGFVSRFRWWPSAGKFCWWRGRLVWATGDLGRKSMSTPAKMIGSSSPGVAQW